MSLARNRKATRSARDERGFTLAFTVFLTFVMIILSAAITAKVMINLKDSSLEKERDTVTNMARIGLNMAAGDILPSLEKVRNLVWTSASASATTAYENTMTSDGRILRQMRIFTNIRSWDAFADWSQNPSTSYARWSKGWEYVPHPSSNQWQGSTARTETFGASENILREDGRTPVTNAYIYDLWRDEIPVVRRLAAGNPQPPQGWRDAMGSAPSEYPSSIWNTPVLKKVFRVRSYDNLNTDRRTVRVAVFVRMILRDYYTQSDAASNVVIMSMYAFSEATPLSKPQMHHQAVNVTLGGAEDRNLDTLSYSPGDNRLFAPAFNTMGIGVIAEGAPISGQLYHASGNNREPAKVNARIYLFEVIPATGPGSGPAPGTYFIDNDSTTGTPQGGGGPYRRRLIEDGAGIIVPDSDLPTTADMTAISTDSAGIFWIGDLGVGPPNDPLRWRGPVAGRRYFLTQYPHHPPTTYNAATAPRARLSFTVTATESLNR